MAENLRGLVPGGLQLLRDNIINKGNLFGAPAKAKAEWAKNLKIPKQGPTVFFAGCGYQLIGQAKSQLSAMAKLEEKGLDAERAVGVTKAFQKVGLDVAGIYGKLASRGSDGHKALESAVAVLQKLGVEFGYLYDEEPCCGAPLYHFGFEREFAQNAQETYSRLKSLGVKGIIGLVPSCTHALQNLFPKYVQDFDLKVEHFSEVVLRQLRQNNITLRLSNKLDATFHDPCQLARYLGLIDEPRQIMGAIEGLELKEVEWTKGEWSTCCGGGGGFEVVFPEMSRMLASNRAQELLETGASTIITCCPGCLMQLEEGLKERKADGVQVLDLAEVLALALEV